MKKVCNVIILVLIIVAVIIIANIFINNIKNKENEQKIKTSITQIKEKIEEPKENNNNELPYIEYEGYQVIGTIKIEKIDLEYPILNISNEETMKKSVTKFWGEKVNEVGNVSLTAHNNIDGTMFGKIKNLENGDKITILDLNNNSIDYQIFDKYVTDPNDVDIVKSVEEGTKEITLITCTNRGKNRLIIKAREI